MAKIPSEFEAGTIEKVRPAPTRSSGSTAESALPTLDPTVTFSKMVNVVSNDDTPG
jgi:hypothetical protein